MLFRLTNVERVKYVFNTDVISFNKSFKKVFDPEKDGQLGDIIVFLNFWVLVFLFTSDF